MLKYINFKIDNSKEASIKNGKWSNPGATFYDRLLKSHTTNWRELLDEAYLIASNTIKNTPHGVTPFSRSGCKYPHHVIEKDKLVLSIPGVHAAYARCKQQGEFSGNVKKHLERHYRELDLYEGSTMQIDESIEYNFNHINQFIMENAINFTSTEESYYLSESDYEHYIEQWNINDKNFLFITGESNSGKTTHATKLAHEYNAIVIGLDFLSVTPTNSTISQWMNEYRLNNIEYSGITYIIEFFHEYPHLYGAIADISERYETFIPWLLQQKELSNSLVIVEGIQLSTMVDYKLHEEYPLVLMENSLTDSLTRYAGKGYLLTEAVNNQRSLKTKYVPIFGIIKNYGINTTDSDGNVKPDTIQNSIRFAKILKKLTRGDNYSHALISLNDKFNRMCSYEDEGYVEEDIQIKLSWETTESIYVTVMFITEDEYKAAANFLNYLKTNKNQTKYASANLLKMFIGRPTKVDKRFVCSSLVGYIMSMGNKKNLNHDYSRLRPEDVTIIPRAFYVMTFKDKNDFLSRHAEFRSRVRAILKEHYEEIDEYNNQLPKLVLADKLSELKTLDKILDWIVNKI